MVKNIYARTGGDLRSMEEFLFLANIFGFFYGAGCFYKYNWKETMDTSCLVVWPLRVSTSLMEICE